MNRERDGHVRIYVRSGGFYSVPLESYEFVRNNWMAGERWIELPGFHGGMLTVKLAEVELVRELPAGAFAAMQQDERETRSEEMLHGGD